MVWIKNIMLPNKPLNNFELEDAVKKFKNSLLLGSFLISYIAEKAA